jgi:hypothetical protein
MMNRRVFLATTAGAASAALLPAARLESPSILGNLKQEPGPGPMEGAAWYTAEAEGGGLAWSFPAGRLTGMRYLTADLLLDGNHLIVFALTLQEGEAGRKFRFTFYGLNQCSFRLRMPLDLVDQHRWQIEREGAFVKPLAGGDRVDLAKVDRMTFQVLRKAPGAIRWAMTPLEAADSEVPKIAAPLLPKGKLVDELGQSTLHDWPAKTRGVGELKQRLAAQLERAPRQSWPESFSRWGGAKGIKLAEGSGYFRTQNDGKRWWLVDPDGYAFWSAGLDCVRVDVDSRIDGIESALTWLPDPSGEFREAVEPPRRRRRPQARFVNYLAANCIRAFGPEGWREKWAAVALAELKRLRFNTVGNWSEWEFAAKAKMPYVRPMEFEGRRCGMIYRDFPDIYHPDFEADTADYAAQLRSTAGDPAFLGYFLMNEPTWAFSSELPAAGMLFNTESCHTRAELARFLKARYPDEAALAAAWKTPVSLERVARGRWQGVLGKEALEDLRAFSVKMVERYFSALSQACRRADPNHLNLGMRWAGVPPLWAVEGMKSFDVFSLNCYREKLPREDSEKIHALLKMPVMVGEWHFGALDAGLPGSGIGHVRTQADRGRAYRVYAEDAAANPYCVGAHWFTLYDESALGRSDGENWNIGFLDVCNRPYQEIGAAAISSHERLYDVAAGKAEPYADAPEYLPLLFN